MQQHSLLSALNGGTTGIDAAVSEATVKTVNNYNFNKTGIKITNVEFSTSLEGSYIPAVAAKAQAPNIRFVRVTTEPSPVAVSFASMVLGKSKNLKATATAGYSVSLTDICDFFPVTVIDYGTPIAPGSTYTFQGAGWLDNLTGQLQILALAGAGGNDARVGLGTVLMRARAGAAYFVDTKNRCDGGCCQTRDKYPVRSVSNQTTSIPLTCLRISTSRRTLLTASTKTAAGSKSPSHTVSGTVGSSPVRIVKASQNWIRARTP